MKIVLIIVRCNVLISAFPDVSVELVQDEDSAVLCFYRVNVVVVYKQEKLRELWRILLRWMQRKGVILCQ